MSITEGQTVAVVDTDGVTWFGVTRSGVRHSGRWPTVLVQIGNRTLEVPARDVVAWPIPGSPGRSSGGTGRVRTAGAASGCSGPRPPVRRTSMSGPTSTAGPRLPTPRRSPDDGAVVRAARTVSSRDGFVQGRGASARGALSLGLFEVGDPVVTTVALRDRWCRRVPAGAMGVVATRLRDRVWLVRLTTDQTVVARDDQLRTYHRTPLRGWGER
jgi:hypothetical protein